MSEDITVTIKGQRGSPPVLTTIASGIVIQLDKVSAVEATGFQSAEPHYTYQAYTTQLPVSDPQLLREGDLLIDQKVIDPMTGTYRQYRIIADAEPFIDQHWEMMCFKWRGR